MDLTRKDFHELFLEAVDSALSSLGDSARLSVYFHLEKKFDIRRDQIPSQVEDFDRGLEKIFGVGTLFLEVLIMKKLYEGMGPGKILKLDESKGFRFVEYVKAAERVYSEVGRG